MNRVVYVLGDDRVCDQVVTLCYSARKAGETSDLQLIPYSETYGRCLRLGERFGLELGPVECIAEVDGLVERYLGDWPLRHPRRLRVLTAWLSEMDAFIYLDADVLLFRPLDDIFRALESDQFVACDYQWRSGFQHVFESEAAARIGFSPHRVFNGGFWGGRVDALRPGDLEHWLSELSEVRPLFDFSSGGTAQPLLNHLVASSEWRFRNLTRNPLVDGSREPGSWAGSRGFRRDGDRLYDRDLPLRYLHWAGIRLDAQAPYGDLWSEFRSAALAVSS